MSGARTPVGVLVSGTGSNLRALIAAARLPDFPASIALVLSNRPGVPALDLAAGAGVPSEVLPVSDFGGDRDARDRAMLDRLRAAGVRLVVCAGYDRLLSEEVLDAFPGAVLNVHPSLLPAFAGGMRAVEEALAHGVKVSGCTVQLLAPGAPDGGPIVLQAAVPVLEDDDAESLRQRIHEEEWKLLPQAVALACTGRLRVEGRRVRILPAPAASGSGPQVGAAQPGV